MRIRSYPKIYRIGNPKVSDIFKYNIAEEKIDGSQISWGVYDGQLLIRSKEAMIDQESPHMFDKAVTAIRDIADRLKANYTYRGEYLRKEKHNHITYARVPSHNIVLFEVEDEEGNPVEYKVKELTAKFLDFDVAPMLTSDVKDEEELKRLLNRQSFLGGSKIKGVVLKNYWIQTPECAYMVAKYLAPDLTEVGVNVNRTRNFVHNVGLTLKGANNARWEKAVQHLKESNQLTNSVNDIGKIVQAIITDVEAEEKEHIQNILYEEFFKEIKKTLVTGVAEWYKEKLFKQTESVHFFIGDCIRCIAHGNPMNVGRTGTILSIFQQFNNPVSSIPKYEVKMDDNRIVAMTKEQMEKAAKVEEDVDESDSEYYWEHYMGY